MTKFMPIQLKEQRKEERRKGDTIKATELIMALRNLWESAYIYKEMIENPSVPCNKELRIHHFNEDIKIAEKLIARMPFSWYKA